MEQITYDDKETLNQQPSIANKNKVTDVDMNEIKSVVNTNSRTSSNNFGLGTDTWTSSGTYAIGDIVVYNDNTYKNLTGTNTTTTPDQDSTNWEVMPLIVNENNNSKKNAYSCDYVNDNFRKKGDKLTIFTGSSAPGVACQIDTTWEEIGKFNYMEIELYVSSVNARSCAMIPFELFTTSNRHINENYRTTNVDGYAYTETIRIVHIIPSSSSITTNSIKFDSYGNDCVISRISIIY